MSDAQRYRRIVVPRHGGPEVLRVEDAPVAAPSPGQVRVRVLAAGVGFPDLLMREGTYPGGPRPPFTPGYDLVGVVDALGPGVQTVRVGERVAALAVYGSYVEMAYVPKAQLVPISPALDAAEAVSLVLNYTTAYQLLHRTAHAHPGERLLVHGAAGGVGSAALQLGALIGMELYGTASGPGCAQVAAAGARCIDYRREDFVRRIRALTGDGVDVVLDGIGSGVSLRSYRVLRRGGRLVLFGHLSTLVAGRRNGARVAAFYAAGAATLFAGLLPRGRRVRTFQIALLREKHPDWFRTDLAALFALLGEGKITPLIAGRLPLVEARQAHELLAGGAVHGKLVLLCDGPCPFP
jgi:NADPH2:quinone reductase